MGERDRGSGVLCQALYCCKVTSPSCKGKKKLKKKVPRGRVLLKVGMWGRLWMGGKEKA